MFNTASLKGNWKAECDPFWCAVNPDGARAFRRTDGKTGAVTEVVLLLLVSGVPSEPCRVKGLFEKDTAKIAAAQLDQSEHWNGGCVSLRGSFMGGEGHMMGCRRGVDGLLQCSSRGNEYVEIKT